MYFTKLERGMILKIKCEFTWLKMISTPELECFVKNVYTDLWNETIFLDRVYPRTCESATSSVPEVGYYKEPKCCKSTFTKTFSAYHHKCKNALNSVSFFFFFFFVKIS